MWVNNTDFNWQAEIGANLKELQFNIKKNDMSLNDLKLDLTGNIDIDDDKYTMDLNLNAPRHEIRKPVSANSQRFPERNRGGQNFRRIPTQPIREREYYENHLPAF